MRESPLKNDPQIQRPGSVGQSAEPQRQGGEGGGNQPRTLCACTQTHGHRQWGGGQGGLEGVIGGKRGPA